MAFSFFPKEDTFNRLLVQLSDDVYNASLYFKEFVLHDSPEKLAQAITKIHNARGQSKATSTQITEELCRSFITPFDREDIHDIASLLYKVPKIIEKVQVRMALHGMETRAEDLIRQADLILQAAEVSRALVRDLVSGKGGQAVMAGANALRDIEHKGDEIRNELILNLFKNEPDLRVVILRRDIYDMLEKVVDRFRDVAGVAMQIVLKNS